jgi:hypothetical protein
LPRIDERAEDAAGILFSTTEVLDIAKLTATLTTERAVRPRRALPQRGGHSRGRTKTIGARSRDDQICDPAHARATHDDAGLPHGLSDLTSPLTAISDPLPVVRLSADGALSEAM